MTLLDQYGTVLFQLRFFSFSYLLVATCNTYRATTHLYSFTRMSVHCILKQGRRHGFKSGRTNSASGASMKFFDPHFLANRGDKILLR